MSTSGAPRPPEPGTVRLVHVVTVPESFVFLRGQVRHMHAHAFRITGFSSPGPFEAIFAREGPV